MGAFIGVLGSLVELTQWEEEQQVRVGRDPTFFEALDGSRTAFVQPRVGRGLREWTVSMTDARPSQAAAFQAMCLGYSGNGPFRFVDPMAQVANALTPRQSQLDSSAVIGGGYSPSRATVPGYGDQPSLLISTSVVKLGEGTPVIPGRAVTVSAWVQSTTSVEVTASCMSGTGKITRSQKTSVTNPSGGTWASVTIVPASGDVQVGLSVKSSGTTTLACPSITWTARRMPWAPGRGAKEVIIHGYGERYTQASPENPARQRVTYEATITEVGIGA